MAPHRCLRNLGSTYFWRGKLDQTHSRTFRESNEPTIAIGFRGTLGVTTPKPTASATQRLGMAWGSPIPYKLNSMPEFKDELEPQEGFRGCLNG